MRGDVPADAEDCQKCHFYSYFLASMLYSQLRKRKKNKKNTDQERDCKRNVAAKRGGERFPEQ